MKNVKNTIGRTLSYKEYTIGGTTVSKSIQFYPKNFHPIFSYATLWFFFGGVATENEDGLTPPHQGTPPRFLFLLFERLATSKKNGDRIECARDNTKGQDLRGQYQQDPRNNAKGQDQRDNAKGHNQGTTLKNSTKGQHPKKINAQPHRYHPKKDKTM